MALTCIIHADDFGASRGVTDNILDAIDHGALSSVSVIPNGYAFDYAMDELKKREGIRLGIHLNLIEGRPILPAEVVPCLVDKRGEFCHSFGQLWLKHLRGPKAFRQSLARQVKMELAAQIRRVRNCFGPGFEANVDSHRHYHMIPFVFDLLMELAEEFPIRYMRMPEECFFFYTDGGKGLGNYAGANIIKHALLNVLAGRRKKILKAKGIRCCDYFVGVLYTGKMSERVVRAALAKIRGRNPDAIVEVLFHPGGALEEERSLWDNCKLLKDYYMSGDRRFEREELKKHTFKELLEVA